MCTFLLTKGKSCPIIVNNTRKRKYTKKMTKTIKKLLIDKDMTVADLARRIGKSRVWTSYVVNGHMKSPAVREAIAAVLDAQVEDLWGNNGDRRAA